MYVRIRAVSDKEDKKNPYDGKTMRVYARRFGISVIRDGKSRELQLSAQDRDKLGTGERYGTPIRITRDLSVSFTRDDLLRIFRVALSRKLLVVPSLEKLQEFANALNVVCAQFGVPKKKRRTPTIRSRGTPARAARAA